MKAAAGAISALVLSGAVGNATELKVVTSVALTSVLNELTPAFEKKTGDKLVIDYDLPRT